ncbi:hypothetical protein [Nocardia violaceofusca]|uniref:hypothetical protein n=1 Tax=Nocardia violaceofusca TaxID=941182 RepID=UPI0007A54DF9|nr:hypothetical protein [Nocardia violaceofusca]
MDIYGEFLLALKTWAQTLSEMCDMWMLGKKPSDALETAAVDQQLAVARVLARLELVASPPAARTCREGYVVCLVRWRDLTRSQPWSDKPPEPKDIQAYRVSLSQVPDLVCDGLRWSLGLPKNPG